MQLSPQRRLNKVPKEADAHRAGEGSKTKVAAAPPRQYLNQWSGRQRLPQAQGGLARPPRPHHPKGPVEGRSQELAMKWRDTKILLECLFPNKPSFYLCHCDLFFNKEFIPLKKKIQAQCCSLYLVKGSPKNWVTWLLCHQIYQLWFFFPFWWLCGWLTYQSQYPYFVSMKKTKYAFGPTLLGGGRPLPWWFPLYSAPWSLSVDTCWEMY